MEASCATLRHVHVTDLTAVAVASGVTTLQTSGNDYYAG